MSNTLYNAWRQNDLTRVQVTTGSTNMKKTPGIFIAVFAVYCICALCIGMSSAIDVTTSTAHQNRTFNAGPGHQSIAMGQGAGRPGFDLTNSTQQQQIITRLEKDGINVTEFKTDLQNGKPDAAKTWLENYFQTHKPAMGQGAGRPGFDLTNSTQQQQIITRLEKDGINVTEFKTDLLNGNIDAAKALLDAFMQMNRSNMTAHMKSG